MSPGSKRTKPLRSNKNTAAPFGPENSLKLRIEKVPEPLWRKNLRSEEVGLGKYRWDKLRKTVLETNGAACTICGDFEKPHAHEVWEYSRHENGSGKAKLVKIEIICGRCHSIHHWGMTQELLTQGHVTQQAIAGLEAHFQRVNGCALSDFHQHIISTSVEWQERSQVAWIVDWGQFEPMVAEAIASREMRKLKMR